MAFFKFRWPGQKGQGDKVSKPVRPVRAESIEVMRRRARHRLIGAAMLVLLGVVGFPILFDTQPRPIPVDISIEIPDRNKVAPLVVPAAAPVAASKPATSAPAVRDPGRPAQTAGAAAGDALAKGASAPEAASVVAAPAKPRLEAKPESKPAPAAEPRPVQSDEAARARALLEGRTAVAAPTLPDNGRFIVQIGAFADAVKAREVRLKLERAGIKTYTHVIETPEGKRIRVRVGPFDGKAEAEKAAARIKGLNLPVSILLL
ncbi:MAG: SPOR domain-containing protein [Giesbergeria sp.]|jgi:DedD protein|nr:SPOR domain-containing protein [Giesbergeria sp.]